LKLVEFTPEQISIVNGSLLGDACLYVAWPGTSKNYTFAKMHSVKQNEYVDWVYEKLKPFTHTPPKPYAPTQSVRLRTISHATFTALAPLFYRDGKKILPSTMADIMVDRLAVAVWFMDDGNAMMRDRICAGYHLNTQSFDHAEHERLVALFKELHGIKANIERNKGYYRISIMQRASREKFRELIQEHIIPSMRYKLGYIGDSLRTRRD
jgi:hypothetical protein